MPEAGIGVAILQSKLVSLFRENASIWQRMQTDDGSERGWLIMGAIVTEESLRHLRRATAPSATQDRNNNSKEGRHGRHSGSVSARLPQKVSSVILVPLTSGTIESSNQHAVITEPRPLPPRSSSPLEKHSSQIPHRRMNTGKEQDELTQRLASLATTPMHRQSLPSSGREQSVSLSAAQFCHEPRRVSDNAGEEPVT